MVNIISAGKATKTDDAAEFNPADEATKTSIQNFNSVLDEIEICDGDDKKSVKKRKKF